MAANLIADSSFLVALLNKRETDHDWAAAQAVLLPPPWKTCEAGLSGIPALAGLLGERAIVTEFDAQLHIDDVLRLMKKYVDVPMSFTDACLVRMSEVLSNPTVLTTDSDFRVYRRHGRQVIPVAAPR